MKIISNKKKKELYNFLIILNILRIYLIEIRILFLFKILLEKIIRYSLNMILIKYDFLSYRFLIIDI